MAELSGQEREDGALDKVRRHVRILVDISRLAGEIADLDRFLDQAVMQVARAVEINHVKVLRYRPRTADLIVVAGIGWKESVVHRHLVSRPAFGARASISDGGAGHHQKLQ